MQQWLRRFGVDDDRIHVESFASNTWENAANIKAMLDGKQVSTLILVTTAWHMPRSVRVFNEQGINVVPAPCDYKVDRGPYDLRSFLPRWGAFADSCDGLHEYLGMLWYSLKRAI